MLILAPLLRIKLTAPRSPFIDPSGDTGYRYFDEITRRNSHETALTRRLCLSLSSQILRMSAL